ncbi:sodium/proline symporter PutP [Gordonia shandongensis]|uniref:sodium/proline symporter PutP n=1 Tax=Gordonia shandongensis TaxID=376351 RepID=UPI000479DA6D|nr:sodium/proline symporter PutP [Gordonia shandongensis]
MDVDTADRVAQLTAVGLYFAAMLGIGFYAFRRTRDSLDDYMLAGRGLKPWVAALSAGASDMSGWLLMGLPGAVYLSGLSQSWIMIGLLVGAWANWKLVAPRLRAYTEVAGNAITIPSFLEFRLRDRSRLLRITCGVVILVFFTFYVSSGMVASGKFFESSFGVNYTVGMLIVAAITMIYTLFGGFLGASLTDVAQGLLVVVALLAVPIIGIIDLGGIGAAVDGVRAGNRDALSFISGSTVMGIVSAVAWGLGYFGQPHILVRFMALRTPGEAGIARRIGIGWMFLCAVGAVGTSLVGIAYFADAANAGHQPSDPETIFLVLSRLLFHPFIAGLVLAAVLAAIMSTISSQLVVCSSALVEDLYKLVAEKTSHGRNLTEAMFVRFGRLGVLAIAVIAALLALSPSNSILALVAFAWAGFGSAFGPAVVLCLYWRAMTVAGALAGIVTGASVAYVWGQFPIHETVYEIIPGVVASTLVAVIVSLLTRRHDPEIDAEFTRAVAVSLGESSRPDPEPEAARA